MNWTAHNAPYRPWHLPILTNDRRLKHFLLASTLAHLSLFVFLTKPAPSASLLNRTRSALTVEWQPNAVGDVPVQTVTRITGRSPVQANSRNGAPDHEITDKVPPSSADSFPTPPAITPGFVESARDLARESIRGESVEKYRHSALLVPAENLGLNSPQNSRVSTQKPSLPGETRFADGRIRVVDRWGRVSCFKEPPEYVYSTGGVMPRMAVSTNCP